MGSQNIHLDFHTVPELSNQTGRIPGSYSHGSLRLLAGYSCYPNTQTHHNSFFFLHTVSLSFLPIQPRVLHSHGSLRSLAGYSCSPHTHTHMHTHTQGSHRDRWSKQTEGTRLHFYRRVREGEDGDEDGRGPVHHGQSDGAAASAGHGGQGGELD